MWLRARLYNYKVKENILQEMRNLNHLRKLEMDYFGESKIEIAYIVNIIQTETHTSFPISCFL